MGPTVCRLVPGFAHADFKPELPRLDCFGIEPGACDPVQVARLGNVKVSMPSRLGWIMRWLRAIMGAGSDPRLSFRYPRAECPLQLLAGDPVFHDRDRRRAVPALRHPEFPCLPALRNHFKIK